MARKPLREAALQVTLRRINSNYYLIKHKWLYWKLYYLTKLCAPPTQGTEMPFLKEEELRALHDRIQDLEMQVKEAKDLTAVLESNLKTARKCDVNASNPRSTPRPMAYKTWSATIRITSMKSATTSVTTCEEITDTHHGR
ncbi:unnamed protein product [Fusarium fujikuroi]|nr:unnamed protein product [Fusarium fujikuroi]